MELVIVSWQKTMEQRKNRMEFCIFYNGEKHSKIAMIRILKDKFNSRLLLSPSTAIEVFERICRSSISEFIYMQDLQSIYIRGNKLEVLLDTNVCLDFLVKNCKGEFE